MHRLSQIRLFIWIALTGWALDVPAQVPDQPPASLHQFFCHAEKPAPPGAWEQWMRRKRPKKLFLPPPEFDYGMTQPLATPSNPADDPFEKNLKVYNQQIYVFGISGARGYNLRNWPKRLVELREFLRFSNLIHPRNWLPQPESNALRMQNLIGASFYFHF